MRKITLLLALCLLLGIMITACGETAYAPPTVPTTIPTEPTDPTDPPAPPAPEHSELYIPGLSVEDVITYFNEVCLDAEFSTGDGNTSLLQRWESPIRYYLNGTYTEKDLEVLEGLCDWLNTVEGFPGISEAENPLSTNLHFHFCTADELVDIMGSNYENCDGAVTFWYYTKTNVIYSAKICIRNDMDQYLRNSVIQEELYNGLGPVQDTELREDSIIYSYYSEPQELTEIDKLLIRLLYHPDLKCGMDAAQCEAVIRQLYY